MIFVNPLHRRIVSTLTASLQDRSKGSERSDAGSATLRGRTGGVELGGGDWGREAAAV
jgi:hypothetical protein